MKEEWRNHPDYNGLVQASSLGRIRTKRRDGSWIIRQSNPASGYLIVAITKPNETHKPRYVHALVAETWIGPRPEGAHTRHIDGDNRNNAPSNLCYGTAKENKNDVEIHPKTLQKRAKRREALARYKDRTWLKAKTKYERAWYKHLELVEKMR